MRLVIFGGLVLLVLILQVAVADYVSVFGIKPDLVILLVALNGFFRGTREGALWGVAAGLLVDLVSGSYWGTGMVAGLIAGYTCGLAGNGLYKDNRLVAAGVIFFILLLTKMVTLILLSVTGINISLEAVFRVIIPVCLYNTFLVFVLYGLWYRLFTSEWLYRNDF